jgi:hypothetical protein
MVSTQPVSFNSAEEDFLVKGLLSELNNSILDSSQVDIKPTMKRANSAPTATTSAQNNECDFESLLEGADSWDWDDMETEVPSKVCALKIYNR